MILKNIFAAFLLITVFTFPGLVKGESTRYTTRQSAPIPDIDVSLGDLISGLEAAFIANFQGFYKNKGGFFSTTTTPSSAGTPTKDRFTWMSA